MRCQVPADAGPVVLVGAEPVEQHEGLAPAPLQVGKVQFPDIRRVVRKPPDAALRTDNQIECGLGKKVVNAHQAEEEKHRQHDE